MEKKKKLRFCFYCGSMIAEYGYKKGVCQYCGVKLPYKNKKQNENLDFINT